MFPTSIVAITSNNPYRAASGVGGGVEAGVHFRGEDVSVLQSRCPDVIQQFRSLRDDVRLHSAVGDDTWTEDSPSLGTTTVVMCTMKTVHR